MEEPNGHLFLKGSKTKDQTVTIPIPQVEESLCNGYGGCAKVRPKEAIREIDKRIGPVRELLSCHFERSLAK